MVTIRNAVLLISLMLWTTAGCMSHAQEGHSENHNPLPTCPDSPNCVSTKSTDPDRAMSPLSYIETREKSRERLILVLRGMKGCTIVTAKPAYVHAEFRSDLFGFVDDVKFVFDDDARLIHFRSASRTGYYDFGVNRNRMKEISQRYMNPTRKKEETAF